MDWLDRMNSALSYIEDQLAGSIDYQEAARRACLSSYGFQRMFSFIADLPLSEYVRRRRLTLAALECRRGDAKVIDVALKYGYESPSAFARAFQALHGVSPSEAKREGVTLKAYPRISFHISIRGDIAMNYRMEHKSAFRMVGLKEHLSTVNDENKNRIPVIWSEVHDDGRSYKVAQLSQENPKYVYGVCANFGQDAFDYYVAAMSDSEPPEGMEALLVPAATWAIFECTGPMPGALQRAWQRVFTEWLPTSGYDITEGPELEWYSCGDNQSSDYRSEVWIPVVPAK